MTVEGMGNIYNIPVVNKKDESDFTKKKRQKKNSDKRKRKDGEEKKNRDGRIDIRI